MMVFEQDNLGQMRLVRSMVAVACLDWLECDAAHLRSYGFTFTFTLEQVALLLELEVELAMAQITGSSHLRV